ncbi:MAG TPA: YciI family protein, partial [Candidatus Kapabacteria bacterium]|nr:YciI family protein [Candidatus Kapabacteria bacterium]
VKFSGKNRSVSNGPFPLTGDLVAGYWIWQCSSLDEAVEWLKRAPFQEGEVEIRQIFEAADFGENFTPELREQEARNGRKIAEYAN